jgi:signal transduction histidine kinase
MCGAAGRTDLVRLRDTLQLRYGATVHVEAHHSGECLLGALQERVERGEEIPLVVVSEILADGAGLEVFRDLAEREYGSSICKILLTSEENPEAAATDLLNGVVPESLAVGDLSREIDRLARQFQERTGSHVVTGLPGPDSGSDPPDLHIPSFHSFLDERDLSDADVEQAMIDEMESVLGSPPRRRLTAGTLIFAEGESIDGITVVLDGQVRLFREVDGRELAFHQLTAGRVVGLMSLARSGPAVFSVAAETDVTVLEVSLEELDTAMRNSPRLAAHFVSVLIRSLARRNLRSIEQQLQMREFAQSRIQESERLAVVGQLAAGVAHELNNPLQGIVAYSHLLMERLGDDDSHRSAVEKIVAQADRCITTVRALLDFSRPTAPRKQSSDLNALLGQCVDLVEAQAMFINVEFKQDLDPALPSVMVDPAQIQQVLVNLIVNAAEAMDGAGRITINSRLVDGEVVIEIADEGPGIDPEDLDRVFDPFFSTKEVGHGTGLGLAISHGIVHEHQGQISVDSRPGAGATFAVRLPITADRPWSDSHEQE